MTRTAPLVQVIDILDTSLVAVLDALCTERYGGPVSLERVVDASLPPSTVRFQLHRATRSELRVDFTVRHVGGTVYDVKGSIENGPSRTFTYSLPETTSFSSPRAPHLAQAVASFLLDALEQRMGNDLLRATLGGRQRSW
jgi:hypothetical protein